MNTKKMDPIFNIETPLLFAHRGGAKEAPESTVAAFKYAIDNQADVLELDIQLTEDRKIVVWHGPKLDNVKIKGQSSSTFIRLIKRKRKIWHYNFDEELKDRAWVAHPKIEAEKQLNNIPEHEDRKLILLVEFLDFLNELDREKKIPLNIELKGQKIPIIGRSLFLETSEAGEPYLLKQFKEMLDHKGNGRKIVVASLSEKVLLEFDKINTGPSLYPTNLSVFEQMRYSKYMAKWYLHLLRWLFKIFIIGRRRKEDLQNTAFETSYELVTKELVERVREEHGSIYVFLTSFGFSKALVEKHKNEKALVDAIYSILNTGVDGIMTDYPKKIGKIIRKWSSNPDN
jgi:glycerophosphoryl diester phosphodiesterase